MRQLCRAVDPYRYPATISLCISRAMSSGGTISAQLKAHITKIVSQALKAWTGDDTSRAAVADSIVHNIESLSLADVGTAGTAKELNATCARNSDLVVKYLRYHPGDISNVLNSSEEIKQIIHHEVYRSAKNEKIFEDITSHHYDIQMKSWEDTVADAKELATYAHAAAQMGEKKWVKTANEWIRNTCYRFFCQGGARKALLKTMKKANGGTISKASFDSLKLSENLMESKNPTLGSAFNEKIRMLDIGACYNPLATANSSDDPSAGFTIMAGFPPDAFDVLGVDLYPANPTVLQCDFLNVNVSSPDIPLRTAPAIDIIDGKDYQRVVSIPAQSYDAACMCLVLSYLPEPNQRLQMVQNAWAVLKDPSADDGPEPHRTGLLVIVEKLSVFGNNSSSRKYINEWRDSIEKIGFDMVSAQCLSSTDNHAYGMVFRKVNRTSPTQMADGLFTRRERTLSLSYAGEGLVDIGDEDSAGEEPVRKKIKLDSMENNYSLFSVTRPLRVAIVGGGIGGFALALALQKLQCVSYTVYEKDTSFDCRKQGYALTMQQGLSALRVLGIDKDVLEAGITSTEHVSYDSSGNILGIYGPNSDVRESEEFKAIEMKSPSCNFGLSDSQDSSSGHEVKSNSESRSAKRRRFNVHIPRQRLRDIMLQKIRPDCIAWGHKIINVDAHTQGVRLKFENGVVKTADIIVAADGINSALRRTLFPEKELSYLGLLVVLGISKRTDIGNTEGKIKQRKAQWVDGTTRVFSMPFDRDHVMWQLSFPVDSEKAALVASETPQSLHASALRACSSWDRTLVDLVEGTDLSMISGHPVYDLDPGSLHRKNVSESGALYSRITFIGDAVHPMSPFKGQGANQALADAVSLARMLSSLCAVRRHSQPLPPPDAGAARNKIISTEIKKVLIKYEDEMNVRSESKVLKSRSAALYLHSDAALASGNISRAAAAAAVASPAA